MYQAILLIALLIHPAVLRSSDSQIALQRPKTACPDILVSFKPYEKNPVFEGRGPGHWDVKIRERGWILRDENLYHMWYTGYDGTRQGQKYLGYARSSDGLTWDRYGSKPLLNDHWIEDMIVIKQGEAFYMFAEGRGDQAHLFRSENGVEWKRIGRLDVRLKNGKPIPAGPYGTPTAWFEDGTWYLFYERRDAGVWLATSTDMKVWTNHSDKPVLSPGPGIYDRDLIAMNQIVKYKGRYYAYYHGTNTTQNPRQWTTAVAVSNDLIHWQKYHGNPLLEDNKSSGILVPDGDRFRLYSMHDQVHVHLPKSR